MKKLDGSALSDGKSKPNKIDDSLLDEIRNLLDLHRFYQDEIIDQIVEGCKAKGFKKEDVLKACEIIQKHQREEGRLEEEERLFENPLIVPPGLHKAVMDFEAHFAVSGKDPIMILGSTGVGKSLFLYYAKALYLKSHQNKKSFPPVVQANCGHFRVDHARSELFGHVKGAFTGAIKDKIGIVEKANGGLLILDEIGELPFEVQGMLLTFVETGDYQRLGDEKILKAKVKLVSATNRPSALRDEFRHRFFPFYIPPIRERKGDILYYLKELYPEIADTLSRGDLMLLFAHNWPGNVREIERMGRLLRREQWTLNRAEPSDPSEDYNPDPTRIHHLDPKDTSFDPNKLENFVFNLKDSNVDIQFLEKILNKHRLSLLDKSGKPAFKEIAIDIKWYFSWFDQYTLKICTVYDPFEEVYDGYQIFCDLFLQDPSKDKNILETIKDCVLPEYDSDIFTQYLDKYGNRINKLQRNIMLYLKDEDGDKYTWQKNPYQLWKLLEHKSVKDNDGESPDLLEKDEIVESIVKMKQDDLLRYYYRIQLKNTGGNVKAAAQLTGLKESTFRNRMKNLGMSFDKIDYRN